VAGEAFVLQQGPDVVLLSDFFASVLSVKGH
jgi:hypothetical protein